MKLYKKYDYVRFTEKVFYEADSIFQTILNGKQKKDSHLQCTVTRTKETWTFDTLQEFLAAADSGLADLIRFALDPPRQIEIRSYYDWSTVSVQAPTREEIEKVFAVIDELAPSCVVSVPAKKKDPPVVFVGHGSNPQWRDLKDHLHEQHGYDVEAYEIGSRAGHAIRDILEDMMKRSSFAFLVMTGEDEDKSGKVHARLNVIHEAGLFQGKLGFSRAVILLEEGTEEFSNISGLQQIRFGKGRIKETFGDVLAVLRREFELSKPKSKA